MTAPQAVKKSAHLGADLAPGLEYIALRPSILPERTVSGERPLDIGSRLVLREVGAIEGGTDGRAEGAIEGGAEGGIDVGGEVADCDSPPLRPAL